MTTPSERDSDRFRITDEQMDKVRQQRHEETQSAAMRGWICVACRLRFLTVQAQCTCGGALKDVDALLDDRAQARDDGRRDGIERAAALAKERQNAWGHCILSAEDEIRAIAKGEP